MKVSISRLVRDLFQQNNKLNLKEIYDELSKRDDLELTEGKLQHRIRSTIYSLKKNGEIIRISDSTYKRKD